MDEAREQALIEQGRAEARASILAWVREGQEVLEDGRDRDALVWRHIGDSIEARVDEEDGTGCGTLRAAGGVRNQTMSR